MRYEALALAALFGAVLWGMYRRRRAAVKAGRAGLFDACLSLFDSYRVTQDDIDFPVLTGRYRGHPVRLEALVDDIALRKLPSLWLLVTLRGPVPFAGVFDLLVRPQNVEFYSPSAGLDTTIGVPPGWPPHAAIRTDRPGDMPPLDLLQGHIGMFDDPRTKELLVTPRGVRIVYQANQAQRAQYLVLRQAEFAEPTLSRDLVRRLLDRAVALYGDLAAGRPAANPTRDEAPQAPGRRVEARLAV